MATKAKKRLPSMPKLGWKDQLFYLSLIILTGAGAFIAVVLAAHLQNKIAFADECVIAKTVGAGNMNMVWLPIWLFFACALLVAGPYQRRTPIFGRSDIRYGPPAYPSKYPLLMKNRPKPWVSKKDLARKRKYRVIFITVASVTFLFSLAAYPMSFCGRSVMREDGTLATYDALNRQEKTYALSEITEVRLNTYASGRGWSWKAEMAVETSDKEQYRFAVHSFEGSYAKSLQTMLQMKELYGSRIVVDGRDDLWKVVRDQNLDTDEESLLYQLFSP